ncbi:hypothetical protein DPMN_023577 [Dreissena polymorpha]|uniref:Uncharacterized protein n=1 Tax=Dreissena polymorpha TaxID=45954 RepID=A0A9D4LPY5_DREPO|nr:hypothetical protein DPMN_023577 [Dreissena polymorpha]
MENLRLPTSIAWCGIGGLTCSTLGRSIEAYVLHSTLSKVLLLQHGGNDLCTDSCTKVRTNIKRENKYLRTAFTDTAIIWVDIIDRINWCSSLPRKIITSKRRRVSMFWSSVCAVGKPQHQYHCGHSFFPPGWSALVTSGAGVLSGHPAGCHYAIFITHNI